MKLLKQNRNNTNDNRAMQFVLELECMLLQHPAGYIRKQFTYTLNGHKV